MPKPKETEPLPFKLAILNDTGFRHSRRVTGSRGCTCIFILNRKRRRYEYQPKNMDEVKELVEINSLNMLPFVEDPEPVTMTPAEASVVSQIEALKANVTKLEIPRFKGTNLDGLKKACDELGIKYPSRGNDRTLRNLLVAYYTGQSALHKNLFPDAYGEDADQTDTSEEEDSEPETATADNASTVVEVEKETPEEETVTT